MDWLKTDPFRRSTFHIRKQCVHLRFTVQCLLHRLLERAVLLRTIGCHDRCHGLQTPLPLALPLRPLPVVFFALSRDCICRGSPISRLHRCFLFHEVLLNLIPHTWCPVQTRHAYPVVAAVGVLRSLLGLCGGLYEAINCWI